MNVAILQELNWAAKMGRLASIDLELIGKCVQLNVRTSELKVRSAEKIL